MDPLLAAPQMVAAMAPWGGNATDCSSIGKEGCLALMQDQSLGSSAAVMCYPYASGPLLASGSHCSCEMWRFGPT